MPIYFLIYKKIGFRFLKINFETWKDEIILPVSFTFRKEKEKEKNKMN